MKNVSNSDYLRMPLHERVHYLAEAKQGSTKRVFEKVGGQPVPFYRPTIRQVIVDATLYTDRLFASRRAGAVLAKIKEKSGILKAQ